MTDNINDDDGKESIEFSLPQDVIDALNAEAIATDRTFDELIEDILREMIAHHDTVDLLRDTPDDEEKKIK